MYNNIVGLIKKKLIMTRFSVQYFIAVSRVYDTAILLIRHDILPTRVVARTSCTYIIRHYNNIHNSRLQTCFFFLSFTVALRPTRVRRLGCTCRPACRNVNPKTPSTRSLDGRPRYLQTKTIINIPSIIKRTS